MSRTAWSSVILLGASLALAQENVFMLDELEITGQVREPAVAIISSRLQPEITGFRLEKSFFDQVRAPDEELVDLDRGLAREARLPDRETLLARTRVLQSAAWPLKGGAGASDDVKPGVEGQSGH
jgi:hypothetical protein